MGNSTNRAVNKLRFQLLVAASIVSVGWASPAFAQAEAAAADDSDDNVILVTAEFRERSLQETPLAITAISAELMDARGQSDISDIAAQAPNVSLEEGVGQRGGGLIAYIRGIGQYNSAPFYEPGVGTYVDDVYIASMHGGLFRLLDLDRVEVLRGPQGTLAGKNSVGGAIKLFTQLPQGDGSGYVEALYGSYDRLEGRAAADFALTPNLFARVNIAGKRETGYITRLDYGCLNPGSGFPAQVSASDDCELGHSEGENYLAGRLALRWMPADGFEVNISADMVDDNSEPGADMLQLVSNPANVPPENVAGFTANSVFATGGTYTSYADYCNRNAYGGAGSYCFDPRSETDTWGLAGTIDIELSDNIALKSITSYRAFDSYIANDSDGTPIPISNLQVGYRGRQFSQELRLNAELSDSLNLTAGAYLLDAYFNGEQRVDIQYFNFLFFNDDDTDTLSKALYAQVQWSPIDRLHLTGGIRYTRETKDYVFYRTAPDGNETPIPGLFGLEGHYKGDHVDYRANVSFDVTDDIMAYAQYSTAFKGGGTNGQPFFANQVYPFGPEFITAWEAGLKTSFMDNRVTLNLAGFYSDYTDIQLQALSCPPPSLPTDPCAGPQNVGSAHIKGFEVELFAEPVDGFNIDASLSHVDFSFYEIINSPIGINNVTPFTPAWKWSLGAQYEIELPGGSTLTPRLDVNNQSDSYTDPVNASTNLLEGRTLANARLAWQSADGDLEIAAEVTNLTDKYYYQNRIDNTTFVGQVYGYPGAPRRWSLSVRQDF